MEKLGPLIGGGYMAEVFAYGEDKAIKLLFDEYSAEDAEGEARVTAFAREAGLPAPKILGVETVDGRPGIVMERVGGPTMLRWGTSLPWRVYTGAKILARLHAEVHSKAGGDIPNLRERLMRDIEDSETIGEDLRKPALERLASLPDGDAICHGDFHPDNIIMSKAGPVIIDWQGGGKGPPAADVARTVVLVESGVPLVGAIRMAVVGMARRIFLSIYLREYFRITGMTWEEVRPWLLPAAVNYINSVFPEHLATQLDYTRRFT